MKKYIIFFAVMLLLFLNGCAKPPDVKKENGTAKAERADSKAVNNIIENENKDLSAYDFLEQSEEGYVCRVSLGGTGNHLNIDAVIQNADREKAAGLEAKANLPGWDVDRIKESFFEGKEGVEDITGKRAAEASTEEYGEGEYIEESQMAFSHDLQLRSGDNTELDIRDIDFHYNDDALGKKGKVFTEKQEMETDFSDDFTMEAAWDMLVDKFEKAGFGEIEKECGIASYGAGGVQEYSFSFTMLVNELPLVTAAGSVAFDELVAHGSAVVMKEGMEDIQFYNTFWEILSEQEEEILNAGQLMELLEQYVEEGKIMCSDSIVLNKCELSYFLSTKDWKTAELTPAWRVYIPWEEKSVRNMGTDTVAAYDIVINAVTGEILRVVY
ncbi:MAG: hypothetical protein K2L07_14475 [Lachnospiraceae bacterium]|nr:hypothetical protein [Lachnospiraceae bacterium]